MPAIMVFDGWSNDCHWVSLLFCPCTTRLPDGSSFATEEAEALVVFEDQMVWPEPPSRSRRPPVLLSTSTPEALPSGLSRLATQQAASASSDAVNQMPRYLLVGTPVGEKKPRVNKRPAETSVSPSVMLPPLMSVSDAVPAPEALKKRSSKGNMTEGRFRNLIVDLGSAILAMLLLRFARAKNLRISREPICYEVFYDA
ncbi:hypothetical protein BS78_06G242900 [Paspalum vaginatum]|nr:hypothetical protein BS78_06G242900 [Paspalum vaginatum]